MKTESCFFRNSIAVIKLCRIVMKIILFFLIFFFYPNSAQTKYLGVPHLKEMAEYEFSALDLLMISKHGFTRIRDIEDFNQRVYTNHTDDPKDLVVVTIIRNEQSCSNILSIVNNSASDIARLKEELPLSGFWYNGRKQMSEKLIVSQFASEKNTISITDHVTETGAYQILLLCKK